MKNKTVLITGGATGLGLSVAKLLINKGSMVHIVSRNQENLVKASQEINSSLLTVHVGDITNYESIKAVVTDISQIDILINSAGVWTEGQIVNNSAEQISQTIDVNLKGTIYTVKAVLPLMLAQKSGYILNVSSTSGLKGRSNEAVYVASKMGVTGFTKSLQEDMLGTNIKVAGFYPGGMSTQFFEKGGFPKDNQDWMNTDKVAQVIAFMLEQDDTMIMDQVVLNKRKMSL